MAILVFAQIGLQLDLRMNQAYWEDSMDSLTYKIEVGPEKELLVGEDRLIEYTNDFNKFENFKYQGDSMLSLSLKTWPYLFKDGQYKNAAYSSWLASNPIRLLDYYRINPKKIPDNIYAEGEYIPIAYKIQEAYGYSIIQTGEDWVFMVKD